MFIPHNDYSYKPPQVREPEVPLIKDEESKVTISQPPQPVLPHTLAAMTEELETPS
jgi:hypothetical protein